MKNQPTARSGRIDIRPSRHLTSVPAGWDYMGGFGDQIPTLTGVYQSVRLDCATVRAATPVAVVEAPLVFVSRHIAVTAVCDRLSRVLESALEELQCLRIR
jgi:hypothetical protein